MSEKNTVTPEGTVFVFVEIVSVVIRKVNADMSDWSCIIVRIVFVRDHIPHFSPHASG